MTFKLTKEQKYATELFASVDPKNSLFVVTGGPGSGKTTLIKHLQFATNEIKCLILAPTGCAASRIEEATGRPAHVMSKVEFSKDYIASYQNCVLILDEASMIPVSAARRILHAFEPIKVLVMGDPNQIPCVEGVSLLSTLIMAAPAFPICRLVGSHRQTGVETCALRQVISSFAEITHFASLPRDHSFAIYAFETEREAIAAAAAVYTPEDQMIAFTNVVANALNQQSLKKSDRNRVMCTKNLYDPATNSLLLVANGVRGWQTAKCIKYDNGYEDKIQGRSGRFMSSFSDARCITAHKAQGSEYGGRGIIVPSGMKGGVIPREIIYTAITRFKAGVAIYGARHTIERLFSAPFTNTAGDEKLAAALRWHFS